MPAINLTSSLATAPAGQAGRSGTQDPAPSVRAHAETALRPAVVASTLAYDHWGFAAAAKRAPARQAGMPADPAVLYLTHGQGAGDTGYPSSLRAGWI